MRASNLTAGTLFKRKGKRKFTKAIKIVELAKSDHIAPIGSKIAVITDNCKQVIMLKEEDVLTWEEYQLTKFYIVFPRKMVEVIKWPEEWRNQCAGNMCTMLSEVTRIKSIGSEIKLIWNNWHRQQIILENNITYQELEDYLKSDCSILSFKSVEAMLKAENALLKMGAVGYICVQSYRNVLLQQAHYHNHKSFSQELSFKK